MHFVLRGKASVERKQNGVRDRGSVVPVVIGTGRKFQNFESSKYQIVYSLFANGIHLQTATTHRDKDTPSARDSTVHTHKKPRPGSVPLGESGKFDILNVVDSTGFHIR